MKKWFPLIAVSLGTFMLTIDTTIVQVALPDMATSLHASFSSLQWVIDGYTLALAALLLAVGALADRLGQRRSYLGGLLVFAAASAVCGAAPNATVLVVFRVVQGLGGAALFATTTALLNSTYQGGDRGKAFGFWSAVSGAAAAVGPIIGGLLTEGISWRWIFFINLPVCVVALALTLRYVVPDHGRPGGHIDLPGIVTFTVAAAALTYALIDASEHGWGTAQVYVLIAVAVVALAAFVVVELRSDHAMLDLSLFRHAGFNGVMTAALVINFVAFAAMTYTSIWLQGVEDISPIGVGLTNLPLAVAAFVVSILVGTVSSRLRPGLVIASGMACIAVGSFVTVALLHGSASWPALMAGYALTGIGTGLAVPTFTAATMGSVPPDRGGMASGAMSTARQLGFAIGIAVLGNVFALGATTSLTAERVADPAGTAVALSSGQATGLITRAGPGGDALRAALHQAALAGLDRVFLVTGVVAVVAGLAVLTLVRSGTATDERPAPASRTEPADA